MPFQELKKLSKTAGYDYVYVVDKAGDVQGYISLKDVIGIAFGWENKAANADAKEISHPLTFYFTPEDSLDMVMRAFEGTDLDEFPVFADKYMHKMVGVITKNSIIKTFNREMMRKDMVDTVSGYIQSIGRFKKTRLESGKMLQELEVPGSFINKTLPELQLRTRYGVEVILIKQQFDEKTGEKEKVITPRPDYRFRFGDTLLVVGEPDDIKKLEQET